MIKCRSISLLVPMLLVALVVSRPTETTSNSNASTVTGDTIFALTPNSTAVERVPRPRGFDCEVQFINQYGLPQIKGWMAILQALSEEGLKDYSGSISTTQIYRHPSWPGVFLEIKAAPGKALPRSFLMPALEFSIAFLMKLDVYCYEFRTLIYDRE